MERLTAAQRERSQKSLAFLILPNQGLNPVSQRLRKNADLIFQQEKGVKNFEQISFLFSIHCFILFSEKNKTSHFETNFLKLFFHNRMFTQKWILSSTESASAC